ncbi:MAG: hypothetical protein ACR2PC_06545 [Tsuneonella suprasediminis]|nr:hypothetical protein LBX01_09665 [Altererythrobacter sp. N1]
MNMYAVMGVIRALQRRSEMPEIHRAECNREAELLTHIICGAGALIRNAKNCEHLFGRSDAS